MRKGQRGLLFVYAVTSLACLAAALWSYDAVADGDGSDTLVDRLALFAGVAGLLVSLWGLLSGKWQTDRERPVAEFADALAQRVRQQWETAEDIHRLNDDYAMSVSWVDENGGLTVGLPEVRAMASAAGNAEASVAADTLAGEAASLGAILREQVPTGRLVVLGDEGSGKTVLLERLVYDTLRDRPPGGVVHVRFPMSHWPLQGVGLNAWMASYLTAIEPTLAHPAPTPYPKSINRAEALLRERLVVPVLDGFDELPASAQAGVLENINRSLRTGDRIILASRPAAYRAAVSSVGSPLKGAAGIVLQPVSAEQAEQFLRQKKGDWDELCALLGTDTPVGRTLKTPLALFLCRTVYEHRPAALRSSAPSELCSQMRFPTEAAVRAHLFAGFIPAVYRNTGGHSDSPWGEARAARTLRILARYRRDTEPVVGTGTDLSWWKLHHFTPRVRDRLTWGIALACGALWLPLAKDGLKPLLMAAVLSALFVAFARSALSDMPFIRSPAVGLRWRWRWIPAGIGAVSGLAWAEAQIQQGSVGSSATVYVIHASVLALVGGALFSWSSRTADLERPVTPRDLLRHDGQAFLAHVMSWGLALPLLFAVFLGLFFAYDKDIPRQVELGDLLLPATQQLLAPALFIGLAIGVPVAFSRTACGPFVLACLWHGLLRRTPFRLLAFLEDAHLRGVLRQIGGSYEFRHVELQQHLAGSP